MPRQSKGHCLYCGKETTKAAMTRHLAICQKRQEAMAQTKQKKLQALYHLRVQDAYRPEFWLDLEMRGSAKLWDLDSYLRVIWLECCGHLSQFSIGGWAGEEIPMNRRADQVFELGLVLTHIYDFGTSSETLVKVVSAREAKPTTSHPIALMARNLTPEAECLVCKGPATKLCIECLIEHNTWGTLCDEHAETHPHADYGEPIPLVNSPRLGMCGYTGPAEPPY
jgi:hypothetical protein